MRNFIFFLIFTFVFFRCINPNTKDTYESEFNLQYTSNVQTINSIENEYSHFGIQFNGMPFHENVQYENLDIEDLLDNLQIVIKEASALGLKWARVSVDWSSVEDNQGVFHWEILDEIVDGLVEKNIEIYLCLHGGHKTHTGFLSPVSDEQLKAWSVYASNVISRYKNQIDYWEIWNEANTIWFWKPEPNAEEYINLVKFTRKIIDELDPGSTVIGGGVARLDVPFAEKCFQLGIADYINVFSFHPYSAIPESVVKKVTMQVKTPELYMPVSHTVDGLFDLVEASGKDIEIWQGECGYPSAMNSLGWNGTGPWSETIQSKWILRMGLTDLAFEAPVSCYFLMKEAPGSGEQKNAKGLLKLEDNSRKPSYYVYQNLISVLRGKIHLNNKISITKEMLDPGSFSGMQQKDIMSLCLENEKSQKFIAWWLVTRIQSEVTPARINLTLDNIKDFNNPKLFDLLTGKIYTISDYEFSEERVILRSMPVSDFPFLISWE
ncbi:MAG: hypothetical protein ACP5E3_15385 [Bacteroidales bacterium]